MNLEFVVFNQKKRPEIASGVGGRCGGSGGRGVVDPVSTGVGSFTWGPGIYLHVGDEFSLNIAKGLVPFWVPRRNPRWDSVKSGLGDGCGRKLSLFIGS